MKTPMILETITPEKLNKFIIAKHPEANFLQSSSWGKVYELTGDQVHYLGLIENDKLVGVCLAIVKPAKRGRYLEIPGGPLIDWESSSQVKATFKSLKQLAAKENCVFIRIRPNIPDTAENQKILKQNDLHPSPMHLHAQHTVVIDLTRPEDQLLADMRRQTRYEVRRASKLNIKVTSSSETAAFKEFYQVQLATAKRQNFIPSSEAFIIAQHEAFQNQAKIYKAELDGKALAYGLILLQAPEAIYHEAASTPEGLHLPGAYALQWQVIQDAKSLGLKRYNLFGIAPPGQPHHRYAGVTTFKTGFGGTEVNYLPAHDLVVDPVKYQITKMIEIMRKKKRNL
ncbi:aminoacyltransferase [Candidatus Saccharibacteria bacterium]|nr:aminoacyltransferase [Candidatus Saccharibacteria bacterium]